MTDRLVVHGFETSNNMKVRVALGYKGLPYEFRTVDPAAREEIIRLSGQALTPVLTHGDTVLFDSAAILRYLDANFPATPKIFGCGREEQWAIEEWERFGRGELASPMMAIIKRRISGGEVDDTLKEQSAAAFAGLAARLVAALEGREWLVGSTMTAADITTGAVIQRIRGAGLVAWPAAADPLVPWAARVMAYDAGPGVPSAR